MTSTILETRNPAFGFFRTMEIGGESPETAWHIASRLIADATDAHDPNAYGPEAIRDFLDSRMGRHFADEVLDQITRQAARDGHANLEACIAAAITRHQNWRINHATQRTEGIPAGLPYLTGWVQYFAIAAELHDEVEHP